MVSPSPTPQEFGYLPLQLNYGLVMLYNISQRSEINNFRTPDGFNWANIYMMSPYGIPSYRSVGQSCLFNGRDIVCQLAIHRTQYPIVEEAKLVTIEI